MPIEEKEPVRVSSREGVGRRHRPLGTESLVFIPSAALPTTSPILPFQPFLPPFLKKSRFQPHVLSPLCSLWAPARNGTSHL